MIYYFAISIFIFYGNIICYVVAKYALYISFCRKLYIKYVHVEQIANHKYSHNTL